MGDSKPSSATTPRKIVLLAVAIVLLMVVGTWSLFFSYTAVQKRNMRAAAYLVPVVENVIRRDDDYELIDIGVATGGGGGLGVWGYIPSGEPVDRLKKLIDETNPPVDVKWFAKEVPPDVWEQMKARENE